MKGCHISALGKSGIHSFIVRVNNISRLIVPGCNRLQGKYIIPSYMNTHIRFFGYGIVWNGHGRYGLAVLKKAFPYCGADSRRSLKTLCW
jgi:hypothetical protein